MTRFILIFVIVFLMVMSVQAQERHGGWGGHGGGGHWGGGERHEWHGGGGWDHGGWGNFGGNVVGGAIGSWLWNRWAQPQPQVVVVPQEPYRDVGWCMQRYRSYNPSTHVYLGYDGQFHGCP